MICRDTRKDYYYFEEYISNQKKRITRFENIREKLSDEDKIKECNVVLANLHKNMFFAMFSAGYERNELIKSFNTYIDYMLLAKDVSYDELVNAAAIDIFLNSARKKELSVLSSISEKDALSDALLGIPREDEYLLYKANYEVFYKFLNDAISKEDFIKYITDEWYASCKDLYWYDSLKSESDTYVGYWCWLAAAILSLKELSVDNEYIPKM